MKLLLTSAGFTNKSIVNALQELVGENFSKLNLAFIPTAANVERGDKGWLIDDLNNCKKLGFASIDIVDISAVPHDIWQKRLEEANILMFGGGNTFHLIFWLEKSGLKELLPKMLKDKIYVGISAGSMVAANNLALSQSEKLYSEETGDPKNHDQGLGYVNFHIRPHLNSPYFPKVRIKFLKELAKEIPEPIYAIDDNTAIKVVGNEISVVTEGLWKKFN